MRGEVKFYCALHVVIALKHIKWIPWGVCLGVKPWAVMKQMMSEILLCLGKHMVRLPGMTWKVAQGPPKPTGSRGRDWKSQMLVGVAVNLMHSARSIRKR